MIARGGGWGIPLRLPDFTDVLVAMANRDGAIPRGLAIPLPLWSSVFSNAILFYNFLDRHIIQIDR